MKIQDLPTDQIKPYSKNNRTHPESQISRIAESIKEFGFNQPLVVDEHNEILVGHGRLLAAQKLGLEKCPTVVLKGLAEREKRAYRILDNKLQNDSSWEFENLKTELEYLTDENFDLEAWGLDELAELLPEKEHEVSEDDFEPTEQVDVYIKRGDIIELGDHRVWCLNSREKESWSDCDVVFTSPPYNRGDHVKLANKALQKSSYQSISDDLKKGEYREFIGAITCHALAHCKCMAINIQMLAGNKIDLICWLDDFHDHLIDVLIWNKRLAAPAVAHNVVNSNFEFVFLLSPEKLPSRAIPTADFHGNREAVINVDPTRSLEFASIHGATMPVKFAAEVLKTVGGSTVCDPFLGTGTTLIACDQLSRICYGMEIEPRYCQVIIDRYKAHCEKTGKDCIIKINGKAWT